jgi:hypothetical protein
MSSLLRRLYAAFLVLLIAGCSGGGCSSCAGGAITPIRGGFPVTPERRIPRAMQVRLTDQGLRSVEAIAPDLFGSLLGSGIDIPESEISCPGWGTLTVCSGGGCQVRVSIAPRDGLRLGFVSPDQINARIRLVVESVGPRHIPLSGGFSLCAAANGRLEVNTRNGSRDYIGLQTNIAVRPDSHAQRRDYFRADLVSSTGSGGVVQETPGEEIENSDLHHSGGVFSWLIDQFRGTLINQIRGQLTSALGPIQDALAHSSMPDPPGCPTGTRVDGTKCRYSDNSLVPMLLGTDGEGNLGALLASVTPGARGNASYVIAAGDHVHGAQIQNAGMTVNVFGAVVSGQHNSCVPMMPPPAMPTIPEWTNLRQNTIPGTTTTIDLGIGVAEDFLNHALWNLWDSGLFCLGITTRMSQQLSTGLFGALPPLASLRNVTFPTRTAPVALVLRPQQPPRITMGHSTNLETDPLMSLEFSRLAIDFYAWSEERYVRFMTVTTDLTMPVNLTQEMAGLRPVLGMPRTRNTAVSNTELLTNANAEQLAGILDGLLGTAIGMFANNLSPISLPAIAVPGAGGMSVGNINIEIPAEGIQGVFEGASRYLGLFANLQYRRAGAMMSTLELDTQAQLERLPFDARVYQFDEQFRLERLPRVRLRLGAVESFGRDLEFSYRVDGMGWSAWSPESTVEVQSPSFMAQGVHVIEARARAAGEPATADREPSRVEFVIDIAAPTARASRDGEQLVIEAEDVGTPVEQLEYNVAFDDQDSDTWVREPRVRIPDGATRYAVRVRDLGGNEVRIEGVLEPRLIRGGPSTDDASGCGCSTPGTGRAGTDALFAALSAAAGAIFLARRRSRRGSAPTHSKRRGPSARTLLFWSVLGLFFTGLGCNCNSAVALDGGQDAAHCENGARYCAAMNRCVAPVTCECMPGFEANGTPSLNEMTCSYDTASCDCQELPPLNAGMAGSHLDMAVGAGEAVWLSAYSTGDTFAQRPYGDLIVGQYNAATMQVRWEHIDGVPSDGEITGAPSGWRGGISTPGPDVGRWNSLRLTSSGQPRVAYWDTTRDKLKFASFDGTNWQTHVVDPNGQTGRYTSLVMLAGDVPAIAYRATAPDPMMPGRILALVRYARANSATPRVASDWTITDVASAPTSCRANDCTGGAVCVRSTGLCAAPSGTCSAACGTGQACIAGSCEDTYTASWIEDYPPGIGLFNSLALDSAQRPQLVYYDRDRGNLMGVSFMDGGTWTTPFIIDGETAGRDVGDRGAWATLAVGSDDIWHIAYVDAYEERVLYTTVRNSARGTDPEVVDDGAGIGERMFEDGRHVVGDSASIAVDATGTVRVVYQDATAGTLRLATRGMMGWSTSAIDSMNHTGYWARIRGAHIATFFRDLSVRGGRIGVRVQSVR